MLTMSEIYYLNRALDGKKIYGIDSIYKAIDKQKNKINPKDSLINKKVFDKDGKINALSFELITLLDRYKKADSYIWIDNKVVAKDKSIDAVVLSMKDISNINISGMLKSAISLWIFTHKPFLLGYKEVYTKSSKIVKVSDLYYEILEDKPDDEILFLREEKKGKMSFYSIYFVDKEDLFKYDYLSKTLSMINPKDARDEILSLLDIEG